MRKALVFPVLFVLMTAFQMSTVTAATIQVKETGGLQGADIVIKAPQREAQLATGMVTGDFNGDGVQDLALGAPRNSSPRGVEEAGTVSVFFGGAAFSSLPSIFETVEGGKEDLLLSGSAEHEFAGEKLAAGDLNNDNIDDLVIVAQRVNDTGAPVSPEEAKIYVVYGSSILSGSKTLSTSSDVTIQRKDSIHVASLAVGDVNKDSVADLLIVDDLTDSTTNPPVAPLVDGEKRGVNGAVYVFFGGSLGAGLDPATDTDAVIMRSNGTELFQPQGIAIGDFNGDGSHDLLLGVPTEDNPAQGLDETGRVYLVSGVAGITGNLDIDNVTTTTLYGALNKDQIGTTLAAGDVNNDSIDDLVIGAPLSGWGQPGSTGFGKVQVVYGRSAFPSSMDLFDNTDISLALSEATARIGFKTGQGLFVDDISGDGIKDIIIASTNAFEKSGTNGWVHTVFGGTALNGKYELDKDADMAILGAEPSPTPGDPLSKGRLGSTISVADLDNDGKPDLALGAPWGSGNDNMVGNGWAAVLFNPTEKEIAEACLSLAADMSLSIPTLEYSGMQFGITFRYSGGYDFAVDLDSQTAPDPAFEPLVLGTDLSLHLPCVGAAGTRYEFTLVRVGETLMWTIDLSSIVQK